MRYNVIGVFMSRQTIQRAVVDELQQYGQPISVGKLVQRIRDGHPEFKQVADFDFRSAVLAMTAVGIVESTATNEVAIRPI